VKLRGIMEQRLRMMRSLRESLGTTRATVVTAYGRATRRALGGERNPES
jgi:hypothetical protein